ncbi:2-dehydropantoate 2-reductase [Novosphingobium sp. SG707]|uniref:ketopantoate reductase family protein n=1 Tax=Novosphingobium sp. SG707 TaxID=2586996 RepID=UPI001447A274|nr:2-dehydropantoate 2-reductase [Novosphingobium sp. SG707]NKJ01607.1 2-dehydropantoate 2-reductase [Novosphingobium sp. SG707]
MKVVVVGAGAMGTLFGGRLARAGHQVVFVDTDPARVAAIAVDGVWENDSPALCEAALPGVVQGEADLLILFTKAQHTAAAMAQNAGALRPDGMVLTLQNGLGNDAAIASVVGSDRVLVGITNWPADLLGHGRIHVAGHGMVKLWSLIGEDIPVIHTIAEALAQADLGAMAEPSVTVAIWEKVIFNAALNGICALTRMTVGQVGDFLPARDLASQVVEEGIATALANGVAVDGDRVRQSVEFAMANHRAHKPSMLQDVEASRPTEVDAIQGGLLAAADRHGVASPALAHCTALLRSLDHVVRSS